jgi:hypothetical protein
MIDELAWLADDWAINSTTMGNAFILRDGLKYCINCIMALGCLASQGQINLLD